MREFILANTWRSWAVRRLLEAVTYISTFFILTVLSDSGYESTHFLNDLKFLIVLVGIYGTVLLYLPASATSFVLGRRWKDRTMIFEFVLFVTHGLIVLTIMYNQLFGISKIIDYNSPNILSWFAVFVLHILFVLGSIVKNRRKDDLGSV